MGYRSEVIAVFYTHNAEDYPAMKLFIDETIGEELGGCLTEEDNHNGSKYIKFYEEDVKWYDSYTEVKQFMEMLDRFGELADGEDSKLTWAYEFVRIGEDINDIDVRESDGASNALNVHRYVDINL
jgi:tryptophan 2,3-dioxygenase